MRSPVVERLGVQEPRIKHLPPGVVSLAAAEEAIELADAYGICDGFPLAESQKITLRGALGERADGSWAASRVADFGPRQGTGKNDKIAARELAGLVLYGERLIIHTAHEMATAKEAFRRFEAVWENHDDLRKRVARFRYSNEEQGVELLSGQRLIYKARSGKGARGFAKADLLVYDEAQHLGHEHLAASGPAKLANPNSQTWYAGSGGLTTSTVAWAIRRAALGGDAGRLAYTEATAETVRLLDGRVESVRPDPSDRDTWYQAMPGLGRWVTEEAMQALFEELGPELFARECLCVWDPDPEALGGGWLVISRTDWEECRADESERPRVPAAVAFDIAPDRSSGAIACAAPGDGVAWVDVVDHGPGTGWMLDRLVQLKERHRSAVFCCDAAGPAGSLLDPLAKAGVKGVKALSTRDHQQACGGLYDDAVQHRLRHPGRKELDDALAGAEKRTVGDAWLWSRKDSSVDISPLVAVTLAHREGRRKRTLNIENYKRR